MTAAKHFVGQAVEPAAGCQPAGPGEANCPRPRPKIPGRVLVLLLISSLASAATLKVRLASTTVDMDLESYVAAAVAGEASILRSEEALKAMAVAARTYAIYYRGRHASDGYDLCATTHCQRLDAGAVTPRIQAAVEATWGEMVWYQGRPAFACYSRSCGGVTEDAAAVWPELAARYLRSHRDPYCPSNTWQWRADPVEVVKALLASQLHTPQRIRDIVITARTPSGRARLLDLGRQPISATAFRFAIGRAMGWNLLRSDRYEVRGMLFQGSGEGHGVGLCQRGADQMGLDGRGYRDILAFYYPGTVVGVSGRGLQWQRIAGETVALFTTRPEVDRAVLDQAERELRAAARRTNLPAPAKVEVRLYPDVATFRDATGEPGSVAAYTVGTRIQIWRREALRHEMLHVLIEAQAKAGTPVWFREGLAGYLDGSGSAPGIAALVKRYGETTVLGWLKSGLPRDVTAASATAAPTNKR